MPYLIDGTNLVFAVADDERFEPVTEVQVCCTVGRFLAEVGDFGQIVFDGAGPEQKTVFDQIRELAVVFAGPTKDADTVIEEKLGADPASKSWTVVSNDRRLRQAAHSHGAGTVRCDVFWQQVLANVSRKKCRREPLGKRFGLSDGETDRWLETFRLDEQ